MADKSTIVDGQQTQDRHIKIHHDVINSAIISGDNNKVVIYHVDQQIQTWEKSSLSKLGVNPYRGLATFEVEDADVFFGRENEVDRLWHRLWNLYEQSQHDKLLPRLLPIIGPSGSGKSSLARAGLLPELARRPLPGYKQTRVLIVKPGDTPLKKLALILARIATGDLSPIGKAQEFQEVLEKRHEQGTNDGLSFIASILPEQDYPLVVLVDQFEEIYSPDVDTKQRAAFVETLLEAAVTRKAPVSVVITLRSDFLGETQRHPKFNQIIGSDQSVFLPVMSPNELRLAIEKPAEQAGHSLDFATVDQLVAQTKGREGALPLLQFALTRIWEELSDSNFSKSTKDILREIGGVGGALAGEADRIYKSLDSQEQDIARRLFIGLVEIRKGVRTTRRRVKVSNLFVKQDEWKHLRKVLEHFSSPSARLIMLSSVDKEEVAEVTHETLFEHWKQLRGWLNEQLNLLRQKQKLEDAAEEWQQEKLQRGYLLQGRQLSDAERFDREHRESLPLSKTVRDFIKNSKHEQFLRQLRLTTLLFVPLLLSYFIVAPLLQEQRISSAFNVIRSDEKNIHRELEDLTKGCWAKQQFSRLPLRIITSVFGLCSDDLAGINLAQKRLVDVELLHANLRGTNFRGANLVGANLSFSNLYQADLRGANLYLTNLYEVDLTDANLLGAKGTTDLQLSQAILCQTALPEGTKIDPNKNCLK